MMVVSRIKDRARKLKRRVVLPEGTEPRVIQAARRLVSEEIASVILLGEKEELRALVSEANLNSNRVELIEPAESKHFDSFVADFLELRKAKGISEKAAREAIADPLCFGAMLVRHDFADASVAGSVNATSHVLRAAMDTSAGGDWLAATNSVKRYRVPMARPNTNDTNAFLSPPSAALKASMYCAFWSANSRNGMLAAR